MGFGPKKGGGSYSRAVSPSSYNPKRTKERRIFHRNNLRRGVTAYHPKTAITLIAHPRAIVRRMGRRTQLWPRQPLSTSGQLFLNLPKVTSCLVGSANTADVIIKAVFIKRSLLRRQLSSIFSSIGRNFRFENERVRTNEVKIISQYDIKNYRQFYSHLKIYSNPEERFYRGHSSTKLIVKSRLSRRFFEKALRFRSATKYDGLPGGSATFQSRFLPIFYYVSDPKVISILFPIKASEDKFRAVVSSESEPGNSVGTTVVGFSLLPCFLLRGMMHFRTICDNTTRSGLLTIANRATERMEK